MKLIGPKEIKELTGYSLPSKQKECLQRHGIFFVEGRDGRIATTQEWVSQAASRDKSAGSQDEFDLEALDG